MSTPTLHRAVRALCTGAAARRAYTTVRVPTNKATTVTRPTSTPRPAAASTSSTSSTAGRGNPTIVDTLPNTADEIDVPPEAYSAQPESVPSSSTLAASSAVPAAPFVGGEFAESFSASGTPADPSTPDWSKSYFGLSTQPFPKEAADVLLAPIDPRDVEIKPGASATSGSLKRAR